MTNYRIYGDPLHAECSWGSHIAIEVLDITTFCRAGGDKMRNEVGEQGNLLTSQFAAKFALILTRILCTLPTEPLSSSRVA